MKLAIAVNAQNTIENQHFGDADKFLLYEARDGTLELLDEQPNPFKGKGIHSQGKEHSHSPRYGRKALAVTRFFQAKGVEVLVSTQFGPNIREVCRHFVPVLISVHTVEEAKEKVAAHFQDLAEELHRHPEPHHILRIMDGKVLAIPLKKE